VDLRMRILSMLWVRRGIIKITLWFTQEKGRSAAYVTQSLKRYSLAAAAPTFAPPASAKAQSFTGRPKCQQ